MTGERSSDAQIPARRAHVGGTSTVGCDTPTTRVAREDQESSTLAAGATLKDAVTVVKNSDGKTVVHETVDLQTGQSAMSGALWAGLIGLIVGGPVGWVAGLAVGAPFGSPAYGAAWGVAAAGLAEVVLVVLAARRAFGAVSREASRGLLRGAAFVGEVDGAAAGGEGVITLGVALGVALGVSLGV